MVAIMVWVLVVVISLEARKTPGISQLPAMRHRDVQIKEKGSSMIHVIFISSLQRIVGPISIPKPPHYHAIITFDVHPNIISLPICSATCLQHMPSSPVRRRLQTSSQTSQPTMMLFMPCFFSSWPKHVRATFMST